MKLSPSSTAKIRERCHHLSTSGRRCSQPACSTHPTLCFTHKPKPQPLPSPDDTFLLELSEAASSLASPEDVERVLAKLFLALVEDRITREKAGTLGFLAQMLLRSQHEIAFHKKIEQAAAEKMRDEEFRQIEWNIPRPIRGPISPEDIAGKEKELEELKKQAAEEAAEAAASSAAHAVAGLQTGTTSVEVAVAGVQRDPENPTLPLERQDPVKNIPPLGAHHFQGTLRINGVRQN